VVKDSDSEREVKQHCSSVGLLTEGQTCPHSFPARKLLSIPHTLTSSFSSPPTPDRLATMTRWAVASTAPVRPLHPANSHDAFSRSAFGRGNTKSQQNLRDRAAHSPTSANAPPMPTLTNSPSISSAYSATSDEVYQDQPKKFLNERYAKCSVKGNFLTLAAQPKNVELGEWLAHQGTTTDHAEEHPC